MTRRLDLAACAAAGAALAIGQTVARGAIDLGSPFRATIAVTLGAAALAFAVSNVEQCATSGPNWVYYLRDHDGRLLRVGITDDWPARIAAYMAGSDDDAQPGLSARINPAQSNPIRPCWTRGQAIRIERRRIRAISGSMHRRHPLAPQTLANDQHLLDAQEWAELSFGAQVWLRFWGLAYRAESLVGPCHSWGRADTPTPAPQSLSTGPPGTAVGAATAAVAPTTIALPPLDVVRRPLLASPPAPPPPPVADATHGPDAEPGRWDLGGGIWAHADHDGTIVIGPIPDAPPEPFSLREKAPTALHESTCESSPSGAAPDSSDQDLPPDSGSDSQVDSAGGAGDDESAARISALRAQGMTLRAIATALGVPYSRVQRAAKRLDAAAAAGDQQAGTDNRPGGTPTDRDS